MSPPSPISSPVSGGFSPEFVWGAASSAYQIEGAADIDGRAPSIWDVHVHSKDGAYQQHTGDVACDHYHRYAEDVGHMQRLGLGAYRFSISWPRVLPQGVGAVNEPGLDFYDRLVDALLAADIDPYVTLYHWDLPYALQLRGGWMNRQIADWFAEYTGVIVDRLSDRVTNWMTLNEPQIFLGGGPGAAWSVASVRPTLKERLLSVHHCLLAHGDACEVIRARAKKPPKVGLSIVGVNWFPTDNDDARSVSLARERTRGVPNADLWNTAWYMDPVVHGRYPAEGLVRFGDDAPTVQPGDMERIHQKQDFVGLNVYHGLPGSADDEGAWVDEPEAQGRPRTALDWTMTPGSLYWCPRYVHEGYGTPVYITEHGLSNTDWVSLDGRVRDTARIDFTRRYLMELRRAASDGVDVRGYFHWSILDNFEWGQGYKERFGLIHVDYSTQKRTPKDSYHWYAKVIATHGAHLDEQDYDGVGALAPAAQEALP